MGYSSDCRLQIGVQLRPPDGRHGVQLRLQTGQDTRAGYIVRALGQTGQARRTDWY